MIRIAVLGAEADWSYSRRQNVAASPNAENGCLRQTPWRRLPSSLDERLGCEASDRCQDSSRRDDL